MFWHVENSLSDTYIETFVVKAPFKPRGVSKLANQSDEVSSSLLVPSGLSISLLTSTANKRCQEAYRQHSIR